MKQKTLFEQYLFEAPDDPPDTQSEDQSAPPDVPDQDVDDAPPPDMTDTTDEEDPPDLDGDGEGDYINAPDDDQPDDTSDELEDDTDHDQQIGLDDKISTIMNVNLYQRFLGLLTRISKQQQMIKTNMDIFYTLSPDSLSIVKSLNELDENIRLYLKNNFKNENYSKNLLFFNKCLNLLKLLNDSFDKTVHKGIKAVK